MGGILGGGSNTTTQSSAPPPQVLGNYQGLVNRATGVANTPYTPYPGEMVAPLSGQTQTGLGQVGQYAQAAQPNLQQASSMTQGAAAPVTPTRFSSGAVNRYMNPFTSDVVNATQAEFNNQNEQQAQFLNSQNIGAGAFGGDRAGVSQDILAGQQQLSEAPVIAGLNQANYNQALAEFNNQQQTGLGAQEFNQQQAGQMANQLGNLGLESQTAGIQGANANLTAGAIPQLEQQSVDASLQNQWNAGQAYPFQATNFLGNIIEGTGSQSGGTSESTVPGPSPLSQAVGLGTAGLGAAANLFSAPAGGTSAAANIGSAIGAFLPWSDVRLKENVTPIGKTFDGQTIHKYNFKGDPRTQIGLLAQEVEQSHPSAVHEGLGGLKHLDYDAATRESERAGFQSGGVSPGQVYDLGVGKYSPAGALALMDPASGAGRGTGRFGAGQVSMTPMGTILGQGGVQNALAAAPQGTTPLQGGWSGGGPSSPLNPSQAGPTMGARGPVSPMQAGPMVRPTPGAPLAADGGRIGRQSGGPTAIGGGSPQMNNFATYGYLDTAPPGAIAQGYGTPSPLSGLAEILYSSLTGGASGGANVPPNAFLQTGSESLSPSRPNLAGMAPGTILAPIDYTNPSKNLQTKGAENSLAGLIARPGIETKAAFGGRIDRQDGGGLGDLPSYYTPETGNARAGHYNPAIAAPAPPPTPSPIYPAQHVGRGRPPVVLRSPRPQPLAAPLPPPRPLTTPPVGPFVSGPGPVSLPVLNPDETKDPFVHYPDASYPQPSSPHQPDPDPGRERGLDQLRALLGGGRPGYQQGGANAGVMGQMPLAGAMGYSPAGQSVNGTDSQGKAAGSFGDAFGSGFQRGGRIGFQRGGSAVTGLGLEPSGQSQAADDLLKILQAQQGPSLSELLKAIEVAPQLSRGPGPPKPPSSPQQQAQQTPAQQGQGLSQSLNKLFAKPAPGGGLGPGQTGAGLGALANPPDADISAMNVDLNPADYGDFGLGGIVRPGFQDGGDASGGAAAAAAAAAAAGDATGGATATSPGGVGIGNPAGAPAGTSTTGTGSFGGGGGDVGGSSGNSVGFGNPGGAPAGPGGPSSGGGGGGVGATTGAPGSGGPGPGGTGGPGTAGAPGGGGPGGGAGGGGHGGGTSGTGGVGGSGGGGTPSPGQMASILGFVNAMLGIGPAAASQFGVNNAVNHLMAQRGSNATFGDTPGQNVSTQSLLGQPSVNPALADDPSIQAHQLTANLAMLAKLGLVAPNNQGQPGTTFGQLGPTLGGQAPGNASNATFGFPAANPSIGPHGVQGTPAPFGSPAGTGAPPGYGFGNGVATVANPASEAVALAGVRGGTTGPSPSVAPGQPSPAPQSLQGMLAAPATAQALMAQLGTTPSPTSPAEAAAVSSPSVARGGYSSAGLSAINALNNSGGRFGLGGIVRPGFLEGGDTSATDAPPTAPAEAPAPFAAPTRQQAFDLAAQEAPKYGLNPGVVGKVLGGEMGAKDPYQVGDAGSSFGPWQLHKGGINSAMSGPGMGDEYTKATGHDPNDPHYLKEQTDFALAGMAKQGLTPWATTMGKLGLNKWSARGDQPAGGDALAFAGAGQNQQQQQLDLLHADPATQQQAVMDDAARPPDRKLLPPGIGDALMVAGFGMMAGESSHPAVNIGKGALEGIKYMQTQRQLDHEWQKNEAQIQDWQSQSRYRDAASRLAVQNLDIERYKAQLDGYRVQLVGWDGTGNPPPPPKPPASISWAEPSASSPAPAATSAPTPAPAAAAKPPPDTHVVAAGAGPLAGAPKTPAGAPPAAAAPATPPNAATPPSAAPEAAPTPAGFPARDDPFWNDVPDAQNPYKLWDRGNLRQRQGFMNIPGAAEAGTHDIQEAQKLFGATEIAGKQVPAAVAAKARTEAQTRYAGEMGSAAGKNEGEIQAKMDSRAMTDQSLGRMQDIMLKFAPERFAEDKAGITAALVSIFGQGAVTESALDQAQNYQEFNKDAYKLVMNQAKEQGGRLLAQEIQTFAKASAQPGLTPGAAAAIIAQTRGLLHWQDAHDSAFLDWRDTHPADNPAKFDREWLAHPENRPQAYIDNARHNFPYQGQTIPSADGREKGQAYMTPKGPRVWTGTGWGAFAPPAQ